MKESKLGDIEFPLDPLNKEKKYNDTEYFNQLHWRKLPGGKHEFGFQLQRVIPTEGEIRLLANRHRDCRYYTIGNKFY
jgi:hypothetical protein